MYCLLKEEPNILKLRKTNNRLTLPEVLIALSICSATNPVIDKSINNLDKLVGTEAHSTFIINNEENNALKKLKINITCEPEFFSDEII